MKEFANFEEMFAASIGLEEPWRIERAEFDERERSVRIYVSSSKNAQYPCPKCGLEQRRFDNEEERVWQHGDVVFFPCYVHCRRPRVRCGCDGKTHVVTAPWARERSRYTLLFEAYAMLLAEKLPIEQARRFLRISHTSLTNIVAYWVKKRVDEDDLSEVKVLGIDETSFKKGQSYVTVVTDATARRVIDVEEGRSSEQQVASDMSAAYLKGVADWFPNAKSVIDKFHVKKLLLDAMHEVRREEQGKEARSKKAGRKLLMIPEGKMTEQQKENKSQILAYFFARLTNAISEGINSLIQAGKRKARGFRTFRGYATMIYLTCSKLSFTPIQLFT